MVLDTERRYYVYDWHIKETGEVFYIGKGTGQRYRTRKRENKFFMRMLNTHNCEPKIIKDGLTEKEAFDLEKELISYYRQQDCRLTNICDGGENPPKLTGIPKSAEWKKKCSESQKKFAKEHPEYGIAQSRRLKAYLQTDEGKEFSRKSIEAKKTDSFRKSQSIKCRKANGTKEYRERQSEIAKNTWKNKEYRDKFCGKNNINARKVKQYDLDGTFIKEYETVMQAASETKANYAKICDVAVGKRKTTGGFIWKYSEEPKVKNRKKRNNTYDVHNDRCAKAILQYDLQGNFISEYNSIAEAANINGFNNRSNIIHNLKGKTKHAYGYVWKYKHDNTMPSLAKS